MNRIHQIARRLSPIQLLVLGFVLLSLVGALLLALPAANQNGRAQPLLDALFMAASAVSTTGLAVVDVGSHYTLFGQLVILALLQIGGLGYMTLILFVVYLLGRSLSYHSGYLATESIAMPSRGEMKLFIRRIIKITALFEGVGALALAWYWLPTEPPLNALYLGLFHSVSAFCTAGFALFSDGFVAYREDWLFNLLINLICIAGAVGFFVWNDLYNFVVRRRRGNRGGVYRLSIHSKVALVVSTTLFGLGTAVILLTNPATPGAAWHDQLLMASFQSLAASSTTGFNTVEIAQLSQTTLLFLVLLMYIGAPAGGTGGGIKSTTFGVLLLLLWAVLRNRRDVTAFGRRASLDILAKSVAIGVTAVLWLVIATLALSVTEPGVSFLVILFETASALGTVGLSVGLSPLLSDSGKLFIILTMLIGRVGPLTAMFSLFGQQSSKAYRYPQEDVFVG